MARTTLSLPAFTHSNERHMMDRWRAAPEMWLPNEAARAALERTPMNFQRGEDLEDAARQLGANLWASNAELNPDALKSAETLGGAEAVGRMLGYLESRGLPRPTEPLRIPRVDGKRHTPAEVRRLWPVAVLAVRRTFLGLTREGEKELALALSWTMHMAGFAAIPEYREMVQEARRIRAPFRRAAWAVALCVLVELIPLAYGLPIRGQQRTHSSSGAVVHLWQDVAVDVAGDGD